LTGAACNALDQAVLVVEGTLHRHASPRAERVTYRERIAKAIRRANACA
jgi:hypothetical protein